MKICFGIISYLPEDNKVRRSRLKKSKNLFWSIMRLFPNVLIHVVAQNYEDKDEIEWVEYDRQDKLGIVGARQRLLDWFKDSDFDYMVTFDDDCELIGESTEQYVKHLKSGLWDIVMPNDHDFKMCALSKKAPMEIPKIYPEKGEGFEDLAYFTMARLNGCKVFRIEKVREEDMWVKDEWGGNDSTWLQGREYEKVAQMIDKTFEWVYSHIGG